MGSPSRQGWTLHKLSDLGFIGRGKSKHRPRNDPSLYGGIYPFFQTGDVKSAEMYLSKYSQTYNEKGLAQSKIWKKGTLCITIAANIAETALLAIDGCFPDSIVGFVADPDKCDAKFVKYYIDFIKLQMQSISRGTTQDNLSLDKLLTFDFATPPLPVQHKIASVLSTYDDLIENNARRIAVLEEMAQATYREWFVNFRFPGHEQVEMVDSPLGQITEKVLGEVVDFFNGKSIRAGNTGDYPVYGSNGIIGSSDEHKHEDGVIIGRVGAYCGSIEYCQTRFWASDNTIVAKAKEGISDTKYLYYLLKDLRLNAYAGGSAQPLLTQTVLRQVPAWVPPLSLQVMFSEVVAPLLEAVGVLGAKNANLRHTRDLLLPKLISGEVEVAELDLDLETSGVY